MSTILLSKLACLTERQKVTLRKANLNTVGDLLLTKPLDISKRCRLSPAESQHIIKAVCRDNLHRLNFLDYDKDRGAEKFTTGDPELDRALGGGIRTGMLWEIVGESAAGKTQLALQLSLTVQLPARLGGVSGSSCYLTTSSQLPTQRLVQMYESHPLLSPKTCGLAEVRTLKAETIPKLLLVLNQHLPELVQRLSKDATSKPVKLIVIDALAELFHSADKTSTMTLVERSRGISHVSNLLHILASKHHIAVLVLNEVTDVFDHGVAKDVVSSGDVLYREQVRWFGRADSIPGEDRKEAALGLVWANQVNARIMLTRTNRRRYLDDVDDRTGKRRRLESGAHAAARDLVPEASHIRRLSVVFSSVCSPTSLDYVVTIAGIFVVPEESSSSHSGQVQAIAPVQQPLAPKGEKSRTEISPLDEGCVQDELTASQSAEAETDIEWTDDDTEYWKGDVELDAIYSTVDLDLLCMHNTGSRS